MQICRFCKVNFDNFWAKKYILISNHYMYIFSLGIPSSRCMQQQYQILTSIPFLLHSKWSIIKMKSSPYLKRKVEREYPDALFKTSINGKWNSKANWKKLISPHELTRYFQLCDFFFIEAFYIPWILQIPINPSRFIHKWTWRGGEDRGSTFYLVQG